MKNFIYGVVCIGALWLTGCADAGKDQDAESNTISIEVMPPDITPPTLTLNGETTATLYQGGNYTELGAIAMDDRDGPSLQLCKLECIRKI